MRQMLLLLLPLLLMVVSLRDLLLLLWLLLLLLLWLLLLLLWLLHATKECHVWLNLTTTSHKLGLGVLSWNMLRVLRHMLRVLWHMLHALWYLLHNALGVLYTSGLLRLTLHLLNICPLSGWHPRSPHLKTSHLLGVNVSSRRAYCMWWQGLQLWVGPLCQNLPPVVGKALACRVCTLRRGTLGHMTWL